MFAARMGVIWNWRKSVTSSFRRDNMSSGTLLVSQCCKIKRKSRYQGTRFTLRIKIVHLCGLFAKHAQNSIVWPRDIADDPASLAFEAIETIILKLAIVSVLRIVSKYFETTGAIGTIIWKPGFYTRGSDRFSKFGHFSEVDLRYTFR